MMLNPISNSLKAFGLSVGAPYAYPLNPGPRYIRSSPCPCNPLQVVITIFIKAVFG